MVKLVGHIHIDLNIRAGKGKTVLRGILVDTGATHTVLPAEALRRVGAYKLPHKAKLELGDGRSVRAEFYAAVLGVGDREAPATIATFKGAKPVLGVLVLESLGLKVDPVTRKLEATRPKGVAYYYKSF